jgi:hypothetical protein
MLSTAIGRRLAEMGARIRAGRVNVVVLGEVAHRDRGKGILRARIRTELPENIYGFPRRSAVIPEDGDLALRL